MNFSFIFKACKYDSNINKKKCRETVFKFTKLFSQISELKNKYFHPKSKMNKGYLYSGYDYTTFPQVD